MATSVKLELEADGVVVHTPHTPPRGLFLSWRWLQDHRPSAVDSRVSQRTRVHYGPARRPLEVGLDATETKLLVQFEKKESAETTESAEIFDLDWLIALARSPQQDPVVPPPVAWSVSGFTAEQAFTADWRSLQTDADLLLLFLTAVHRDGFAFIDAVPPTQADTHTIAETLGYVRRSLYGDTWKIEANLQFQDSAYTNEAIDLHTDGTYMFDPPGYQLFHVLAFDGQGGETVLGDGFGAWEDVREHQPALAPLLAETPLPWVYFGKNFLDRQLYLETRAPLIQLDQATGMFRAMRYNPHDRGPFWMDREQQAAFYGALDALETRLQDPARQCRFRLGPGRALLFDNWRTLHARTAFTGHRLLTGAYINREDGEGCLRHLAARRPWPLLQTREAPVRDPDTNPGINPGRAPG